jgi:hypothetical protein
MPASNATVNSDLIIFFIAPSTFLMGAYSPATSGVLRVLSRRAIGDTPGEWLVCA